MPQNDLSAIWGCAISLLACTDLAALMFTNMQVAADDSLAHALQTHPLQLTVHKQGSISSSRSGIKTSAAAAEAAVPVGSAEVDLSPLLLSRCAALQWFQCHACM